MGCAELFPDSDTARPAVGQRASVYACTPCTLPLSSVKWPFLPVRYLLPLFSGRAKTIFVPHVDFS